MSFTPNPHVFGYFWNRRFSPTIFKNIRVHIRIVFARPYENAKPWKYDSTPHRACMGYVSSKSCMMSLYSKNVRFRPSTWNEKHACVFKNLHFGERFGKDTFLVTAFTEQARTNWRKKFPSSNKNGYMRIGPFKLQQ